ncbi:unnamed protein product, partial [Linum tenue]
MSHELGNAAADGDPIAQRKQADFDAAIGGDPPVELSCQRLPFFLLIGNVTVVLCHR